MKFTIFALVLLLATPAFAQQSAARQNAEEKATVLLWIGIGVASAGIAPMAAGAPSLGVPLVAGGGALIFYAFQLHNKAKQMPSLTFHVVPLKKGFALGGQKSW